MGATGTKAPGGSSTIIGTTPVTPTPAPQADDAVQPQVIMDVDDAQDANDDTFASTDTSDYHDLYNGRQYYLSQTFNVDTMMAIQDYLSDQPTPGSLYSPSQELNHVMNQIALGKMSPSTLTENQKYMIASLNDGMHNLGYNLNLEHYGRVEYINNLAKLAGVPITSNNYGSMSISQLKKAFVGTTYSEDKFVSTSYNHFKNAPNGGAPFTDKAVKFNIKAPAKTQALMPGNGPGGQLGEIILKPGQNYRITDVRFTGKSGRSGSNSYRQIEFDVEIY